MEAIPRKFTAEELVQLTAAERRQLGSEFDARKAASEIALRQWCVETAIKTQPPVAYVTLAQQILDFVTAPLKPETTNG
jgi:hypothetical protein